MNVMTPVTSAVAADPRPFELRIEDYELLDRAGAFHGQRVELINGRIVVLNAQHQLHLVVKNEIGDRLRSALRSTESPLRAMIEGSLALSVSSLPDPDILVARVTPTRDYVRPEQVAVIVEVADTSLRHDLGEKRELYAMNGVPEYWVIDINGRQIHQFWSARDGEYSDSRVVPLDGPLASATIPDLTIDGSGIL